MNPLYRKVTIQDVHKVQRLDPRLSSAIDAQIGEWQSDVMQVASIINNVTYLSMGNALDLLRQMPVYQQKFSKVRGAFEHARKVWMQQEAALKASRHFRVCDLNEGDRKFYRADLTNGEYFEYWQATGFEAYNRLVPLLGMLTNKFKLIIEHHGYDHAKALGYMDLVISLVNFSEQLYFGIRERYVEMTHMPPEFFDEHYGIFRIYRFGMAWQKARNLMGNGVEDKEVDPIEKCNVEQAINQLVAKFLDADFFFGCASVAAKDYPEVFATKGFCKKRQKQILDIRDEIAKRPA